MAAPRTPIAATGRSVACALALTTAVVLQAACGSSGDGGTTSNPPACTVSGVTVAATPATVATGATTSLVATITATSACTGGVTWSATPVGGALTSTGLTATFSATTAATYTVSAASTADPTKSGSVAVTVTSSALACGTSNGTVVTHAANITASEAWAGDGVTHVVPNSVTISGSAVVTVQPCAIVALGSGASINLRDNAHLVAAGTSDTRFVLFRRNNSSQAWGALQGVTPTSLIDLTWTTLQGGGAFGGSNPTIMVSGNGYGSAPVGMLRVNNVTIQTSQGVGVFLDADGGFTNDSQILNITGSGTQPVATTMMTLGTVPTGSMTSNGINEILITGPNANVVGDMTVEDHGVPVRIAFSGVTVAPAANATAPVTLTLKPGVVFKFPKIGVNPGARVTFGANGKEPNNVVGVLNAVGTPTKPIVFTSGEATPAPGDWVGLWLDTAPGSRLDYVEISYAGAPSGISSTNCKLTNTPDNAALTIGDFSSQYIPPTNVITNSRITFSAGYGINAIWQTSAFNNPILTATNTFQSNARCSQTYNGLTPPGVCPLGGGCSAP